MATDARCANSERGDRLDGSPTALIYTTTTTTDLPVTVRRHTGHVCVSAALDYDIRDVYEFNVTATDQGHLQMTSTLVIACKLLPRLHQIHVARIQVVSTCMPCRRLHVSCIGDKIVVNAAYRDMCNYITK